MKSAAVAGLLAVLAVGGVLSAFAATRTVETSVDLEVELWVDLQNSSAYVSTRQAGGAWITHDYRVALKRVPAVESLLVSDTVSLSVPVTVEVEVGAAAGVPGPSRRCPRRRRTSRQARRRRGAATCCSVRGMWDDPPAQRRGLWRRCAR